MAGDAIPLVNSKCDQNDRGRDQEQSLGDRIVRKGLGRSPFSGLEHQNAHHGEDHGQDPDGNGADDHDGQLDFDVGATPAAWRPSPEDDQDPDAVEEEQDRLQEADQGENPVHGHNQIIDGEVVNNDGRDEEEDQGQVNNHVNDNFELVEDIIAPQGPDNVNPGA